MKFCKDCTHLEEGLCRATMKQGKLDLVTGKQVNFPRYTAKLAREFDIICGVDAKLFDPKPQKPEGPKNKAVKYNVPFAAIVASAVVIVLAVAHYFLA